MGLVYIAAWLGCYMVTMVSPAGIPLNWLKSNVKGNKLILCHDCLEIQVTELHGNVFKELTRNVTEVVLETYVSYIEPDAFAGLEGITHLTFER